MLIACVCYFMFYVMYLFSIMHEIETFMLKLHMVHFPRKREGKRDIWI